MAHPGLISDEEVRMAAERGVCLEILARPSHSFGNGLLAGLAKKHGARLVINSDSHAPGDLLSESFKRDVCLGAGLQSPDIGKIDENMKALIRGDATTVV